MPSAAYNQFKKNVKQVDKLLKAFTGMRTPQKGRKHLDHFTRAAIMFLCSSWEVYIEQLTLECGSIIAEEITAPDKLPIIVQKKISSIIKNSNHELEPIIAACNWKSYYYKQIEICTNKLNTPKKGNVMELFNKYLGISGDRLIQDVPSLSKINGIINTRGEIAHNIFIDDYVTEDLVLEYYDTVQTTVQEIEVFFWTYIPEVTQGKRPWQITFKIKNDV